MYIYIFLDSYSKLQNCYVFPINVTGTGNKNTGILSLWFVIFCFHSLVFFLFLAKPWGKQDRLNVLRVWLNFRRASSNHRLLTSFLLEHLFQKTCKKLAHSSSASLRCKSFHRLLPVLQPRNIFLKDLESILLKCNY